MQIEGYLVQEQMDSERGKKTPEKNVEDVFSREVGDRPCDTN